MEGGLKWQAMPSGIRQGGGCEMPERTHLSLFSGI